MAVMHTTMIRASITAYSTAVGPSSFFRKLTRDCRRLRILPFSYPGPCEPDKRRSSGVLRIAGPDVIDGQRKRGDASTVGEEGYAGKRSVANAGRRSAGPLGPGPARHGTL